MLISAEFGQGGAVPSVAPVGEAEGVPVMPSPDAGAPAVEAPTTPEASDIAIHQLGWLGSVACSVTPMMVGELPLHPQSLEIYTERPARERSVLNDGIDFARNMQMAAWSVMLQQDLEDPGRVHFPDHTEPTR